MIFLVLLAAAENGIAAARHVLDTEPTGAVKLLAYNSFEGLPRALCQTRGETEDHSEADSPAIVHSGAV